MIGDETQVRGLESTIFLLWKLLTDMLEEMEEEEEMSPGRAAHRELVKKQLSEMVLPQDFEKEMMEAEKPEGMNPNAAEFTADENLRF